MTEISIPISYFLAGLTVIGMIAGWVIWLYATFITRSEAEKMDVAFNKLILFFKELFDEKFNDVHKRLEKLDKNRPKVKVVKE